MKAESYVGTGYQRLLTFEADGGGFSLFGKGKGDIFPFGLWPAATDRHGQGLSGGQSRDRPHGQVAVCAARQRRLVELQGLSRGQERRARHDGVRHVGAGRRGQSARRQRAARAQLHPRKRGERKGPLHAGARRQRARRRRPEGLDDGAGARPTGEPGRARRQGRPLGRRKHDDGRLWQDRRGRSHGAGRPRDDSRRAQSAAGARCAVVHRQEQG